MTTGDDDRGGTTALHGAAEASAAASPASGAGAARRGASTSAARDLARPARVTGHDDLAVVLRDRLRREAPQPHLLRLAAASSPSMRAVPLLHRDRADARAARTRPRSRATSSSASAGGGRRAVAVLPLGADVVDVGRRRDRGEPAVRLHAHVVARDVVARQVRVDRHVDLTSTGSAHRLALELADRLGDHLAVEVEADRGDVARLLAAEQVARAADLEVAHRDLEARAEVGELADRLQPLVRLLGEHAVGAGAAGTRTRAGRGGRPGRGAGRAARARAGRRGRRRAC